MALEINTEDFWKEIDRRVVEYRIEKKLMSEEITKLREQVKAQAAVIEKLRKALTALPTLNIADQPEWEVWKSNPAIWHAFLVRYCEQALAIPTDSTQILAEVRRAEREKCAKVCKAFSEDDDAMDRQVKVQCAEAILALA